MIMMIAMDGQLLLEGNKTGIAWNAHNLILELAKYPENKCIIQIFSYRCTKEQLRRLEEYRRLGCSIEYCSWFKSSWYKFVQAVLPLPYHWFFHTKADFVQFFNFTVPPGVAGRRIAVVHDMAYKTCPHTVHQKTRIWLELNMKRSCRRADHIITVSEFSKREIIKYLHIPKEKVTVVPNAVNHAVYHPDYTEGQIQKVLKRYHIQRGYFLYLGTIEPRKNLERLIGAYEKLCREKTGVPQLVLAGKKGWLCAGIYEKARRLNLGDKILFTGYVSQEDSPVLMCGAAAFVFPSLYEGFGMPPLEAMACGTPVIISNTTSLPEAAGGAGIMVDPESEEEICAAMRMLLENEECRLRFRMLGLERAKKYTWVKSAEMLMDVYRKNIDGKKGMLQTGTPIS